MCIARVADEGKSDLRPTTGRAEFSQLVTAAQKLRVLLANH